MVTDFVCLKKFTPLTEKWLKDIFELQTYIPAETAALLFFALRRMDDDLFPNGKWATIQLLESLIEEAISEVP